VGTLAVVVAGLCLAAALAAVLLIERLARRPRPSLRADFAALFIGLVAAEAFSLPALVASLAGESWLGLPASGGEGWMVAALYSLMTVYVIGRLFPWREVDAMAKDPEASIADVMAELTRPKTPPDERA
jgi:hypothetical protein